MRLPLQLGLVTLITLLLPWSGCQLMREVEQALRQEQQQALLARAQLLARSLSAQQLQGGTASPPNSDLAPLYIAPQGNPIQLDGYADEWVTQGVVIDTSGLRLQMVQERSGQRFLRVSGPADQWRADQGLLLALGPVRGEAEKERRLYWLPLGKPGTLGRELRQWHHGGWKRLAVPLSGAWQFQGPLWSLELALPRVEQLALTWVKPEPGGYHFSGSWTEAPTPAALASRLEQLPLHPLVGQSILLNQRLAELEPELRVRVIDRDGFIRARSGVLLYPSLSEQSLVQGLFRGLYGLVLDQRWGLEEAPTNVQGRLQANWMPEEGSTTAWYQGARDPLTVAAYVPLGDAALLVEASSEAVLSLSNQVWLRLFVLFGLSSITVLLVLWGYAFWLSWRVRSLHRQMRAYRLENRASEVSYRIQPSRMPDEIGDLSRTLEHLQQQVDQYTEYLQTLASKLAHELRTPLAVIHSSLDNLSEEALPESARVYLQRAREGGQRLGSLLDAMSAARRLEQSIETSDPEWFELDRLLESMSAVYCDLYPERRFQCSIKGDNYRCYGDPSLLVQLLDKLVSNAVDFTPAQGLISLRLATRDGLWRLQVDNEGPKLPSAMGDQLFESLVSLRPAGSRGHLGLGLYLVRLICLAFGGWVEAQNRADGGGVQFNCWLPIGGLPYEEIDDENSAGS